MKVHYFLLFFYFIFFISPQLFSQNTVNGNVIDQDGDPVAFANVILLQARDSTTVYTGTISEENGNFRFENIEDNEYVLSISFIGYKTLLQRININGDTTLPAVTLSEDSDALDEVTINARTPEISRSIDRIIFDVENSTLSTGSSWEILNKTPGVIVSQGQLQVRSSGVTVYINDRKVQLTASELQSLLESYSAANIKSVEVITNPPARYDAEGGAIININTSTNLTPGYKGSLEGSYTQAVYPKYRLGTSHYFKTEKLNVFANYSFNPRKEFKNDDSHINFIRNGNIFSRWNTDYERITRSNAHNINAIIDYHFDDKNTLSFSTNTSISPGKTFNNSIFTTMANAQGQLDSTAVSTSRVENDESNIAMDVNYVHTFDGGSSLSGNVHFTKFGQERMQGVLSNYYDPAGNSLNDFRFSTDAVQNIDIVTAQIDYSGTLGSLGFETGGKISSINSESGIDFFNAQNLTDLYDNLAEDLVYDENIYAIYTSFSRDWEKWSAKVGLRGEYTSLKGNTLSMTPVDSKNYLDIFPTVFLQHNISEDHSIFLDFSRRISRPRYESLSPFPYFLTENTFNVGNPNLRASISNNFTFNYTFKNQYFLDIGYMDKGRSPVEIAFQDNQNLTLRNLHMNLLSNKTLGASLTHGRSLTNFWYAQGYFMISRDENSFLAVESNNTVVNNLAEGFYLQLYNSFTISKDGTFTGNLIFVHNSDYISGSYRLDPFTTLSVGLRKTMWNNRAELTLNFEDILNKSNSRLTSQYLNQDNSYLPQEETQYVRIGLKYNFGNFRLEDNQRTIEAEERERI